MEHDDVEQGLVGRERFETQPLDDDHAEGMRHPVPVPGRFRGDAGGFTRLEAMRISEHGRPSPIRSGFRKRTVAVIMFVVAAVVVALILMLAGSKSRGKSPHPSAPSADDDCSWDGPLLPSSLKPVGYTWHVTPAFTAPFDFNGTVEVTATVMRAGVRCAVMNSRGLNIALAESGGASLLTWLNVEREQLYVEFPAVLTEGDNVTLFITYSGMLGLNMNGLYLSTYTEDDGAGGSVTVPMVATQFEAT
jgi:hypothetical protein